jgi:hypothetical protein
VDWSWLAPAVFGVVVTLAVSRVQASWQERHRKSSEKRARMQGRFDEVRDFLVMACEVAQTAELGVSGTVPPTGSEQQAWRHDLTRQLEVVSRNRVAAATGLFVQDSEALAGVEEVGRLVEWLLAEAQKIWRGGEVDPEAARKRVRRVKRLSAKVQSRMDELVDGL